MSKTLRITGGNLKGRKIKAPPGETTRPALARVRQAVFNILADRVPDARFLDLFGGSGAYAIEALSRGAQSALATDIDVRAVRVMNENARSLALQNTLSVRRADALDAIVRFANEGLSFEIVAVAPPHFLGLIQKTLEALERHPDLVAENGLVFVQHHRDEKLPDGLTNFSYGRVYSYGNTRISVLHRSVENMG